MGELHLEIYIERMRREYGVIVSSGKPRVAYRETIAERAEFYHTHKKQTGGAGQFARVIGYVEPIPFDPENGQDREFVNTVMGGNIPHNYIPACEKVCRCVPVAHPRGGNSPKTCTDMLVLRLLGLVRSTREGYTLGKSDRWCPDGSPRRIVSRRGLFRARLPYRDHCRFP